MPKIKYQDINFSAGRLAVIKQANAIIAEYARQGFNLTLRQLYYQFVARDLLQNRQQEYKKLGDIVNDGRLAGLIDWHAIVDRTRALEALAHWDQPSEIIEGAASQFRIDKWATQDRRVEVWIEKDALVGVIDGICKQLDVPYFSCRGYTSQSTMWDASQRLLHYRRGTTADSLGRINRNQDVVILHFGDHDPSGKDMTRDIEDRLTLFMHGEMEVRRLALNWDQIQQYNPPPNFAKVTDPRAKAYIKEFGTDSWELDALDPTTLAGLIRTEVLALRDEDKWAEAEAEETAGREGLTKIADRYDDVTAFLDEEK